MQNTFFPPSVDVKPFNGKVVYEASGRAREYRELACNLYTGCSHGCVYCYAPLALKRDRNVFHTVVEPRKDIIKLLEKDAEALAAAGDRRQVLLCFACDPYCVENDKYQITSRAISILHAAGNGVCTLTKGGLRAIRDLDLFVPELDSFATTLTTLSDAESLKWEPGAALPVSRIAALQAFHGEGIPTWVSLEPVVDPEETIKIIRRTHEYVDQYKVGVLNYHRKAREIDWRKFAHDVVDVLNEVGAKYYLKDDLRKYLS